MSEKQQRLVSAIIDFLNQSIKDGTVKADDQEGLEVAIQCIGEAFGVDPSNEEQISKLSIKPLTLQNVFDVFLKTQAKVNASATASGSGSGAEAAQATTPAGPTAEDKAEADKLKQQGNSQMSQKKYDDAIESYTKAIALDPTNPVYFSNRAAAYSSKPDHLAAIGDAEKALQLDKTFVKAYHRLGHAQFCLGDFKASADAFERGLKLDPSNPGLKSGLANAKAKLAEASAPAAPTARGTSGSSQMPDLGGMADMLRGMGGGTGGMPDIASMMNNPQLMAMASQLAANGGLQQLMSNPTVANMMERMQSGGEMPSMDEIMGDPQLRQLAGQFGGAGLGGSS